MKRTALFVLPVLALAPLGACAPDGRSSTDAYRASSAPASGTPQSPNSLPAGATVNAPLTRPTGEVSTVTTIPPAATRR